MSSTTGLSPTAKVLGTLFLLFQLLFAANNYGPQRIPLMKLVFDKPFVAARVVQASQEGSTARFEDVTSKSGLEGFTSAEYYNPRPSYLEVMAGGVAAGDFDGDGWEDIFLTNMASLHPDAASGTRSTLFRNRGDGTFDDVTEVVGLGDIRGYPQGALFFDFNNNGRQDLYVAAYDGGQLFRNDGGVFTDITEEAGLNLNGRCGHLPCFGTSVASADYNRNGYLDLFIVNNVYWDVEDPSHYGERNLFPVFFRAQSSFLFRNNGDGTFTDVSQESGVTNAEGKGLGAVWVDLTGNLWPDLYVANDLSQNTFYINNGDGTFREYGRPTGLAEIKSSMGVAAGDFNNNGRFDLVITNLRGSKLSLFENRESGLFEYVTDEAGLASSRRTSGWGVEFVDFDLDGHLDIVMAGGPVWDPEMKHTDNLLFRNLGNGIFAEVTAASGDVAGAHVTRGLAVIDYDNDGHPDIILNNRNGAPPALLRNHPEHANNWLNIRLEGVQSNRDGVGARVQAVRTDGLTVTHEVRAGSSYMSATSRTLFIGLGDATPDHLTVRWPSGIIDFIEDVPVNGRIMIREGTGSFERIDREPHTLPQTGQAFATITD